MSVNGQLSKSQMDLLVEKWDKKKLRVSEITDPNVARATAVVLENQYRYLTEAGETLSTDVADFKKIVMPLVRRIFPTLIAQDLVAVQPLQGPVGLAYALRFKYKTTEGGATDGDEMGYNTVHQEYTGDSDASPVSGASGEVTSGAEQWNNAPQGSAPSEEMNEAGLSIEQTTITAVTRKLKARWSLESAQDLKAMHGLDIESELISMIQYEISAEIDRELINKMKAQCTTGNGNLTAVAVAGLDGQWEVEKFRNLYTRIVKEAQQIAITTRRGAGNFIIASPQVITALDAIGNFLISPTGSSPMDLSPGVAKVGSIEGRFDVYRDNFATTDFALIGYKGPTTADAGLVYSPYIPVLLNKTMEPNSFYPIIGVMTRYAITDQLFGAHLYYRMINVDFTGIF